MNRKPLNDTIRENLYWLDLIGGENKEYVCKKQNR